MAPSALLAAPARAAAALLVHFAPLLLLPRLITQLRLTLAALTCRMEVCRRRMGPLVCLFQVKACNRAWGEAAQRSGLLIDLI